VIGLAVEKYEAERAKERQATSTGGHAPQLVAIMPQAEKGKARDLAAAATVFTHARA
jgi:hypothetical protein